MGALYHNYRYIFVINIGTHTNICYKNRYAIQKCDKNRYSCHNNSLSYGQCCRLVREELKSGESMVSLPHVALLQLAQYLLSAGNWMCGLHDIDNGR